MQARDLEGMRLPSITVMTRDGSVIKIVNLCFDVVPPRVDGQYFAMGDVAISLINITHLRDALSKGQVINEAETP